MAEMIDQVIERLHASTINGNMKWERSSIRSSYSTRLDDFSLSISKSESMGSHTYILDILTLEGKSIGRYSSGASLLSATTRINLSSSKLLEEIYRFIDTDNSALAQLLKIIP